VSIQALQGMQKIFGMNKFDAISSAKSELDDILETIKGIADQEERRARLIQISQNLYSIQMDLQKKISEEQSKTYVIFSKQWKDAKARLEELIKSHDELAAIRKMITDDFEGHIKRIKTESDAAAAAELARIEAERLAAEQAERERLSSLGEIGRLKEGIAKAEENYIKSNTELERQRHLITKSNLEKELDLLEEKARISAANSVIASRGMSGVSGISPIAGMGAPTLGMGVPTIQAQDVEAINEAFKEHINTINETSRAYEALSQIGNQAAYDIGAAFMKMSQDGATSANEMIKQAVSVAIAQLMKWAATTVPFPASIPAMVAAGAAGQAAMSGIPHFADGAVISGPTVGLMGEYANARNNPEVVAPLDKLASLMGGGSGGKVEFILKGDTLWGVLKKHENKRNTH
jgi:hypothetical protein